MKLTADVRSGTETYVLTKALLIYETRGDSSGRRQSAVATIHAVAGNVIKAGHPVSQDAIESVFLSLHSGTSELFPERMLFRSPTSLAWWSPRHTEKLFIRGDLEKFDGQPLHHPALVFVVRQGGLTVFALRGNRRPEADTILFKAPYPNIHAGGKVCIGNAPVNVDASGTIADVMQRCERVFFDTTFNHTHDIELTYHPKHLPGLYAAMRKGRAEKFLVPLSPMKTLKSIVYEQH